MNYNGQAYDELTRLIEDWADGYGSLVKHTAVLARQAADYVFHDLLDIQDDDIDTD